MSELVAYLRSSTTNAEDSLPAREDACRAWAASNGHTIAAVYEDDGLSGGLGVEDRPGLAATLLDVHEGRAAGIVVHRLDRFARELHVQEATLALIWQRDDATGYDSTHGEVLRDDPADPMRTFLRQVMGSAAQLERGMIKTRLRGGRMRKAARGGYIGGSRMHPKYGYDLALQEDGKLDYEPVEEEQAVLRRILSPRGEGSSYRAIVSELESLGVQPPSGSRWYPMTVRRIEQRA